MRPRRLVTGGAWPLNAGVRRRKDIVGISAATVFSEMVLEVLDILAYLWPVSVAVTSAAVLALTVGSPVLEPTFRSRLRYLFLTYAIPIVVLLVGTTFRYNGPPHPNWEAPPAWYGVPLYAVLITHAAVLVVAPIIMRGARLRSMAILLPGAWLSLCCWFVAGIVIAGVGP